MRLREIPRFLPLAVLIAAALSLTLLVTMGGMGLAAAIICIPILTAALGLLIVQLIPAVRSAGRELAAATRNVRRSDFQVTLRQMLVFTTTVAVFFAARTYLEPPRSGDYFIFLIKQFLIFVAIVVAVGLPLAWQQQVRQKAIDAAWSKAAETPIRLDPADSDETIDDVVAAVGACPVCRAPVIELDECVGAGNGTAAVFGGDIRWITCRGCRAYLQGIDICEPAGKRAILWEAHITRKVAPSEIRMVVDQGD